MISQVWSIAPVNIMTDDSARSLAQLFRSLTYRT